MTHRPRQVEADPYSAIGDALERAEKRLDCMASKARGDAEPERGFIAHALTRKGSRLHSTKVHTSREEAVKAAWEAAPKAHSVTSSGAYQGRDVGSNIQFHSQSGGLK